MTEQSAATTLPTLLAVDDQPLNIQVLVHIFGTDHHVLTATGGAQALSMCVDQLPDLILLARDDAGNERA